MGDGSRNYAIYYTICAVVYLGIAIASLGLTSKFSTGCQPTCPLLIPDTFDDGTLARNYSACACVDTQPVSNTTVGNTKEAAQAAAYGFSSYELLQEWYNARATNNQILLNTLDTSRFLNASTNRPQCFICNPLEPSSITVYAPCLRQTDCSVPGVAGFSSSRTVQNQECKLLTSPNVALRGTSSTVFYAFGSFYMIMACCCVLVAAGLFTFMDKWSDDFGRLTRVEKAMAFIAKNAPVLVRLCNFVVIFFIVYALVLTLGYNVCDTDTDAEGMNTYFAFAYGLSLAVFCVWGLSCVIGTCVDRAVPKDTPFYTPKTPHDKSSGCCYKCFLSTVHLTLRTGP